MGSPCIWTTTSESVVSRAMGKCARSTIGQIIYYSDHGAYFDGDIHDATEGLHKWALDVRTNLQDHQSYAFTCVCNPYTRIPSSFFDQIASFRRFLMFVRDTIKFRKPMDPDIHWSAMSGHTSTFIVKGGAHGRIIWTEGFNEGMQHVLDAIEAPHTIDDYFSMHRVYEIHKRDFDLFRYDFEAPGNKNPLGEIDLDAVYAKLGD